MNGKKTSPTEVNQRVGEFKMIRCPHLDRANRLIPALLATAALISLTACEALEPLLEGAKILSDDAPKPTARIVSANLTDLDLESASLAFDVEVSNPYSVPLPLTDLEYGLASGGNQFLTGKADVAGSIPAGGSKTITMPAVIRFTDALAVLKKVRPGQLVPYQADLDLSVDAPGVGPLSLPLSKEGELPVPAVPDVQVSSLKWDRLSLDEATAILKLKVGNTNDFPLDLSKLAYGFSLAGEEVANADVAEALSFKAGQDRTVQIPLSFSPSRLGLAFLNLLRGDSADYDIAGTMSFGSPFGPLDLPFQRSGKVPMTR